MAELYIDSMVLNVTGLSQLDARQLVLEIALGLGVEGSALGPSEIPALLLEIPAGANPNVPELGRRIVAEILREVRRLP